MLKLFNEYFSIVCWVSGCQGFFDDNDGFNGLV